MTNPWFQLGAAFAVLVMLGFVALEGERVGQSLGLLAEDEPVLVFTIPSEASLLRVRAAVAPSRVLHEDEDGLALEGGRVYVSALEEAGDLIEAAGWVERPIQIVGLGMAVDEDGAEGSSGRAGLSDEERLARLRRLVHKPTLTRGEQVFVLQAMNDGLEL